MLEDSGMIECVSKLAMTYEVLTQMEVRSPSSAKPVWIKPRTAPLRSQELLSTHFHCLKVFSNFQAHFFPHHNGSCSGSLCLHGRRFSSLVLLLVLSRPYCLAGVLHLILGTINFSPSAIERFCSLCGQSLVRSEHPILLEAACGDGDEGDILESSKTVFFSMGRAMCTHSLVHLALEASESTASMPTRSRASVQTRSVQSLPDRELRSREDEHNASP